MITELTPLLIWYFQLDELHENYLLQQKLREGMYIEPQSVKQVIPSYVGH